MLIAAGAMFVTSTLPCASNTDDRIESSFRKSCSYKIHFKDDAIKIESRNGVVTVIGTAKNAPEKTLITKLATDINGVKSVVNNMTIAPAVSESGVKPARVQNLRVVSTRD